jgi:hypothetical protein
MGDDFSNRQCYVGDRPVDAIRSHILEAIVNELKSSGYSEVELEDEATRALVIGPTARWIFIGDTTGSTDVSDPTAFTDLSLGLSSVTPTVDVLMSDSSIVHLHLYKDGTLIDKYGNGAFPLSSFGTRAEAAKFKGNPELWAEYLVSPYSADDLRKIWYQVIGNSPGIWREDRNATSILARTADILGWDPDLCFIGYTYDEEGIGYKYSEYSRFKDRQGFTELYFHKDTEETLPDWRFQ